MAGMREIRRRIRTVRNVQQITRALKLVSAARLQRAQSRATAARPYADEMRRVMSDLAGLGAQVSHPLLEVREPVSIGTIAITSDRGMAGGYNMNVIRRIESLMQFHGRDHVKVAAVGKRGRAHFLKRRYDVVSSRSMPASEVSFFDARQLGDEAMDLFARREVDAVFVVYTRFYSAVRHVVTVLQLLPVQPPTGETGPSEQYLFEPEPGRLLGSLLPRYVRNQIYQAMLDSLASEHAARMTAMTSATDNAEEMIGSLTLQFNRARQAAITKELAEIIGSANAVS